MKFATRYRYTLLALGMLCELAGQLRVPDRYIPWPGPYLRARCSRLEEEQAQLKAELAACRDQRARWN